jgi:hypothetical protein
MVCQEGWRSLGGASGTPKLLLKGIPAEANVSAVMWALQAQGIDVIESMIHLSSDDTVSEPFVELNSVDEQRDLLEMGRITIKRTMVPLRHRPPDIRDHHY